MSDIDYEAAVAVIGMAGRFPGADSVEQLWDNVVSGRLGLRQLDDAELIAAGVSPAQLADPDYVRTTGSISNHEMFDAGMFGLNRREAELMDPQHRIFMETTFEALENAGYPAMGMKDRVGIFAGCGYPDYMWSAAMETMSEAGGALMMAIGNERDSLASFVSYKLNLRGPSITVQTFCSTSLVAVHLATQSLLNFECEVALAGGVFVPLPQGVGYAYEEGGILSPDGRPRAFDAGARGSVMGSGASVVVLKRLADAIADGDHISAVVLGSATNNDGSACAGYTAPGVDGQAAVIADALSFAGVKPETVDYVECHGTGTVLGDSIEVAAMSRVFPDRADNPVVLGSLKASIGHLDRAAGTTSMIRAMLALRHRILPATPHYETPNPALASARNKFTVLTENRPWPAGPWPRRAGVSAFGLGGTNAHVVLEEPPRRPDPVERPGPHILVVSGRDQAAADQAVEDLLRHLDRHPEQVIADVAFTLQQSRSFFPVRHAVVCADAVDARHALGDPRRWLRGEARMRDPVIELVVPALATVLPQWWVDVERAARQVLGEPPVDPSPAGAAIATIGALRRLGLRIGRLSGPDEVTTRVRAACDIADDRPGQYELVLAPDADTGPATDWLARTIARLWQAGAEIAWAVLHPGSPHRVPLPTYPFQRRRYWIDGSKGTVNVAEPLSHGRVDDLDRWTYVPTWRNRPAIAVNRNDDVHAAGPWLVLAAEERGEAVAAYLRGIGADLIVARPGPGYSSSSDDEVVIRPGYAEDMQRLLTSLASVPKTVVHAFGLGPQEGRAYGFGTALALTRAYSHVAPDLDLNLLAVTEGAVSVAGEAPSRPEQAALTGLLPVLAQENPGWLCRPVDVGPGGSGRSMSLLAAAIVGEALAPRQGPVVLRGRSRWCRTFAHLPLPSPEGGALAAGAVVLITGGLGHVGLILARQLAVKRGCRVVLTSRTSLPTREHWEEFAKGLSRPARLVTALLELERLGGEILVVAADTSDVDQLRAAVTRAEERFGPIDLVVHAAGISDRSGFGPAHMISEAGMEQHFTSKVAGFEALRQVFAGRDVPGITLSSLSAMLGGLALGPYSAANAALDAHLLAARAADGLRWVTVDWDTWGKGTGPDLPPPGDYDMTSHEAVEIFERAVAALDSVEHIVISTGDLDTRFQQWVVNAGARGSLADDADVERDPRPDLSTPYVEPAAGTEAALAEIWARVLRLETVGAEDDFFGLGGNSVLAIEVVGRIRKGLRVPVPTAAVMGYPTVRGLASQIDELMRTPAEV
jgi:acyl transferase domain-containing protein/acyl carrier protein